MWQFEISVVQEWEGLDSHSSQAANKDGSPYGDGEDQDWRTAKHTYGQLSCLKTAKYWKIIIATSELYLIQLAILNLLREIGINKWILLSGSLNV